LKCEKFTDDRQQTNNCYETYENKQTFISDCTSISLSVVLFEILNSWHSIWPSSEKQTEKKDNLIQFSDRNLPKEFIKKHLIRNR